MMTKWLEYPAASPSTSRMVLPLTKLNTTQKNRKQRKSTAKQNY